MDDGAGEGGILWRHQCVLLLISLDWTMQDVAKRCCPGRVVSVLEGGYGVWRWEKVSSTPKVMKLKVKVRHPLWFLPCFAAARC